MDSTRNKAYLFVLLFLIFIDWMSIGLVYPMFSSMTFHQEAHFLPLGSSESTRGLWLGALLAVCPLAQFFSSPVLGRISDRLGRAPVLKVALAIIVGGYFTSAMGVWLENLFCLLLGQMIVGCGTGNASVVNAAIADFSQNEDKAKNFGLVSMANGLGFCMGPFLGGQLSQRWNIATPFHFACLVSLCNFVLVIFVFRETIRTRRIEHVSESLFGLTNLRKIAQHPMLRSLLICFFIFCVGWSFYWEFISVTWIQRYGLNAAQVGNLYAYGAGCFALSSGLLIRPALKWLTGIKGLLIALTVLVFSLLPLLWYSHIELFWGFIPLQQYCLALLFPISATLISDAVTDDTQGEMMGIVQSIESLAFAATPLFAGMVVAINVNMPMFVGIVAMLLASLLLYLGSRKTFNVQSKV